MSELIIVKEKRAGRSNKPRSRANKGRQIAYASEPEPNNDSGVSLCEPQTPQKGPGHNQSASGSNSKNIFNNQNGISLKQPKTRSRPKNTLSSPQLSNSQPRPQVNRQSTPPQSAGLARSTSMSTPFAGSTFHASPAPSSLPMPRGRKPTSPPVSIAETAPADLESAIEHDPGHKTPTRPPLTTLLSAPAKDHGISDSPLEFLFQRDRAQKQKGNATTPKTIEHGLLFGQSHTVPRVNTQNLNHTPPEEKIPELLNTIFNSAQKSPSSAKSLGTNRSRLYNMAIAMEAEHGYSHQPVGSSFARPFNERLKDIQSPLRSPLSSTTANLTPPLPNGAKPLRMPSVNPNLHTPPTSLITPPGSSVLSAKSASDLNASLQNYLFNLPTPDTPVADVKQTSRSGIKHPATQNYYNGYPYGSQNNGSLFGDFSSPTIHRLESGFTCAPQPKALSPAYEQSVNNNDILEERLRQLLNISPAGPN